MKLLELVGAVFCRRSSLRMLFTMDSRVREYCNVEQRNFNNKNDYSARPYLPAQVALEE